MKRVTVHTGVVVWAFWQAATASSSSHHLPAFLVEAYTSVSGKICDHEEQPQKPRILNESQLTAYRKDGFVLLKNVLHGDLADRMARVGYAIVDRASHFPQYFSVIENGLIFNGGNVNDSDDSGHDITQVFREVALYSDIPQIAAELMELDDETQNLRVIRDMFLAKPVNGSGCDWHVDDHGFWPESYLSEASQKSGKDQNGVNVWIALEDMPLEFFGSMALAAGSHREPWRFEAYLAIGQNRTIDGGHTKSAIVAKLEEKRKTGKVALGACEIGKIRPDLKERLDAKIVIFDIERGDMIFSTRTLFHKTLDPTEAGKRYYQSLGLTTLNRYSIRYTPGNAKLPKGWLAEWSAVADKNNPGKSLNEIVDGTKSHPGEYLWYPQVWPSLEKDLENRLNFVADTKLSQVKQQVQAEIVEIFVPKMVTTSTVQEENDSASSSS
ncbi:phytanoyl-CoA dioxygenase [Nitzschia inconspicua]|uniref:Phytanoyl-CoA dioxygenase n=1 Tax=Nitzschia inconspicua TaxID=303405 RepID=A0A9K3Q520_9STRA|nr:phytanoyl-CoA dioxygenase [Nitzschia inconspicua]